MFKDAKNRILRGSTLIVMKDRFSDCRRIKLKLVSRYPHCLQNLQPRFRSLKGARTVLVFLFGNLILFLFISFVNNFNAVYRLKIFAKKPARDV